MKPLTSSIVTLLLAGLMTATANAAPTGPVMRLFPTTVLEDIRETGAVAEEMENNLQDVIARLDLQQQLYTESQCAGAAEDQGCERIAKQLGATYLELLNIMTDRLPDMERAVSKTNSSLEKRLREELGQKYTTTNLKNTLLGESSATATETKTISLSGRSGVRLSD